MSAPSPKFLKLLAKLRELFELDKADLDFGLYRDLRARREEIDKFLREELLPQVQGELGVVTAEKIKPMEANSPALMNQKGVDFFHRAFDYVKQTSLATASQSAASSVWL